MDPDIFATNMLMNALGTNGSLTIGTNVINTGLNNNLLDERFLLASCVWGAVAGGYLLYARKQREIVPFIGGIAMFAVSFFVNSWFWMSIACIAIMFGVYTLLKRGS